MRKGGEETRNEKEERGQKKRQEGDKVKEGAQRVLGELEVSR